MKKALLILVAASMALALGGCGMVLDRVRELGGGQASEETQAMTEALQDPVEDPAEDPGETQAESQPSRDLVTVEGAPLLHDFQFQGDFSDSVGDGRLSEHANTESSRFADGSWHWQAGEHPGGGLILRTHELSDPHSYAIGFRIRYEKVGPGWVKILSFRDESIDGGLYFYDSHLQLYPFSVQEDITYAPNTDYDFILSRDRDQMMTVYVVDQDGSIRKVYEEQDFGDESVPIEVDGAYQFTLFTDDYATMSEFTPAGSVQSIRVWDGTIDRISFD